MLEGWARQQRSRLLSDSTIGMRDRLIRHLGESSPSAIRTFGVPPTSRHFLAYFTTSRAKNGGTGVIELHRRIAAGFPNLDNYRLRILTRRL
jgi:hypothetical protein